MCTKCLPLAVQSILKVPGFSDNVFTHTIAGLGAGFFAVCIGSPVDVVRALVDAWKFPWNQVVIVAQCTHEFLQHNVLLDAVLFLVH